MDGLDMFDDALLGEDFGEDLDLGGESLDLDDGLLEVDPTIFLEPREANGRGLKRNDSWDDLVRVVSDESDGEITNTERDELQDFLEGAAITEPATDPTTPDTFDFWDAATSPAPEDEQDGLLPHWVGSMYYDPANGGSFRTMPPKKRMRIMYPPSPYLPHPVTPPTPYGAHVVSMPSLPPMGPPMGSPPPAPKGKDTTHPASKGKGTTGNTQNKNRKTRLTVPFSEMQRLMAVYGPIKMPRKRKGKGDDENGASAKQESIKRKFYRWFPDFEERFEQNRGDGTFRPKFGHQHEIEYREMKRNQDKEGLVNKRKCGREKNEQVKREQEVGESYILPLP